MSKPNPSRFFVAPPRSFALSSDGRALTLVWEDDSTSVLEAEELWCGCPSAAGRKRRLDGITASGDPDLSLTGAFPIGNYAVNLAFSDGHDRGVYPWGYLADLAAKPTVDAFITPQTKSANSSNDFHEKGHQR
ncbi:MAG: gamma-butyrobetaine hydroxylase-like domain-containing protein [Filomicrobium sp.]